MKTKLILNITNLLLFNHIRQRLQIYYAHKIRMSGKALV